MPPQTITPDSLTPPPVQPVVPLPQRKKWPLLVIVLVVLVVAVGGFRWFATRHASSPPVPTSTAAIDRLASHPPSAQDVAGLNKADAFFGYFLTAAQQPKTVLTTELKEGSGPAALLPGQTYFKIGFDYQTKKNVFAVDVWTATTYARQRCYQGKELSTEGFTLDWKLKNISASSPCHIGKHAMTYLTDGINTGGLTAAQAQTFAGYLRAQPGLMDVQQLALVEHRGKNYLHFTVQLTPIPARGTYLGGQWLMGAFRKTGLDPVTHPYNFRPASDEGAKIEYYVDPVTKLPVYSEIQTTPAKSGGSSDAPYQAYQQWRVAYQFGTATFDASISNNLPLAIDW